MEKRGGVWRNEVVWRKVVGVWRNEGGLEKVGGGMEKRWRLEVLCIHTHTHTHAQARLRSSLRTALRVGTGAARRSQATRGDLG